MEDLGRKTEVNKLKTDTYKCDSKQILGCLKLVQFFIFKIQNLKINVNK